MPTCLIGTSGWHYRHRQDALYPPDLRPRRWLAYCAQRFDTVEIDATFYRLPAASTFEGWRKGVQPDPLKGESHPQQVAQTDLRSHVVPRGGLEPPRATAH